jgi:hypothetical protein
MARHADPTSKRQRGFKMLDRAYRQPRNVLIYRLMERLNISRGYAETIFASHRSEGKKDGKFVTTFSVVEKYNGKPCAPRLATFLLRREVLTPEHHLTADDAKIAYIEEQRNKINLVAEL